VGAVTETFLLEKSRLVAVNQDERNYHIFYQLLRGLQSIDAELFSALNLNRSLDEFNILTAGNCTVITTPEADKDEFVHTHAALETIHCSEEEIRSVYTLLAAILHLGNLQFSPSVRDDTEFTACASPSIELSALAALLGVYSEQLVACLTTQQMRIAKRSSIKVKILSLEETRNNAQALMKYIYAKLFAWLVAKINLSHTSSDSTSDLSSKFIGILDIFGFEILQNNSFEQLCINFTNERLQQQFNEHVFVTEQEIYRAEGLNWSSITFQVS
jgi:myosin-5